MIKRLFTLIFTLLQIKAVQAQETINIKDSIYTKIEIEAWFPGGNEAWKTFLKKHLKANVPAKNKAPFGTYAVIVEFVVDKNGFVSNITPETNFGYGMENEVIRVLKKGPKWMPAIQNGIPIQAYRRQSITFIVADK